MNNSTNGNFIAKDYDSEKYGESKRLWSNVLSKSSSGSGNPMYGKSNVGSVGKSWNLSEECKLNISINSKGVKHPNANKFLSEDGRSKKVICLETKKEFDSIKEAAEYYECNRTSIGRCCNGIKKATWSKKLNKFISWDFFIK